MASRQTYERFKADATDRQRKQTLAGQDIGDIPQVINPSRRAAASGSFRLFISSYFEQLDLPWGDDQFRVMDRLQTAMTDGGLYALGMPRGSGKTTLAELAALWATMTGRREFMFLVGATATHGKRLIDDIKKELLGNELLLEDWPEICFPIRALQDRANRAKGQHTNGHRTQMEWGKSRVVFPWIPGSVASSAIIETSGLTGAVLGLKFTRPCDGRTVRPDVVIPDDPQTKESSGSLMQCEYRESIICRSLMGLAGPKTKITMVVPCTVITKGDLSSSLLDRKRHPEFQGDAMKAMYAFPTNMKLWEEYGEILRDELRNGGDGSFATSFYAERQAEMDAGAVIAWPAKFKPGELTAIQSVMNDFLINPDFFWGELQGEPKTEADETGQLEADAIAIRVNGLPRATVPLASIRLTAFIDVQKTLLYYGVCAWADDFTGAVIDYGSWPDQSRKYFTLADAQHTLQRETKAAGVEGAIYAGLEALADKMLSREWKREGGTVLKIERLLVDTGFQPDTVFTFARQTKHAALVLPSRGVGIGAINRPMSEYTPKPGEKLGFHWFLTTAESSKRASRRLDIDVNFWKSFLAQRLTMGIGDKGSLVLFGAKGEDHRMIADHCCGEFKVHTAGRGRELDEWRERPGKPDNHFLDVLVGCAASASLLGCTLHGTQAKAKPQAARTATSADYEQQRAAFEARRGFR